MSSKFKFIMYADDTTLILADKNINFLHSTLTVELNSVHDWVKSNKLKLNISKTNCIFFQNRSIKNIFPQLSLQGETLSQVPHTKFLGVFVDENLNWKHHIDQVCIKVSKICGILYKVRYNLTLDALLSIYYTLYYPHLTYCVSVWGSTWPSLLNKFTPAQKKVIRCIYFLHKYDSVTAVLSSIRLLNFVSIHKYFSLILVYKMINNYKDNEIFKFVDNIHQTRSTNVNLICPQFRTTLFKNSILCSAPNLYNAIPPNNKVLNGTKVNVFQRAIRDYLLRFQHS